MKPLTFTLGLFAILSCQRLMNNQPKLKTYGESNTLKDGMATQAPPLNTIANDDLPQAKIKVTRDLILRGRERYEIFCMVCHSPAGDGEGIVTQRGFPNPPSFQSDRLRKASDQHLYDVITSGYGRMYRMGDRIPPRDRWAIVHYVRVLQKMQERKKL